MVAIPAAGRAGGDRAGRARGAAAARSCSARASPRWRRAPGCQRELVAGGGSATAARCAAPTATGSSRRTPAMALWGDALAPREPGAVALVSQSGNVAVNALATRRGLRFHTVIASGNQAVLVGRRLPRVPGRRGRARARSRCTSRTTAARACARGWRRAREAGVRVVVLKVGRSPAGRARGGRPQRRAGRRPARVPQPGRGGGRGLGGRRPRAARAGQDARGRRARAPGRAAGWRS